MSDSFANNAIVIRFGKLKNQIGVVYGRLTVIDRDNSRLGSKPYFWCECICGKVKSIRNDHLRKGKTTSCGCQLRDILTLRNTTHGLRHNPLYEFHNRLIERCDNPQHAKYADYGGRGISVCDEWGGPDGLQNFIAWNDSLVEEDKWQPGLEIDRCDNDGNYEPTNCRWATRSRQMRNTRVTVMVTFRRQTTPLIDVFETLLSEGRIPYQVTYEMVKSRYNLGWSLRDSLLSPPVRKKIGGMS